MSLKENYRAEREARAPFLGLGCFFWREASEAALWRMWKSRSDFQGLGETEGNLVLVFLRFPLPAISTALRGVKRISVLCTVS
jgi:hypothetical protein